MTLAELRIILTKWLEELEPWRGTDQGPDDYILTDEEYWPYRQVVHGSDSNRLHIILFTESHRYHISARMPDGERMGYLGCIAQARHFRPGETWTRGNDLHDGQLNYETWEAIKDDILRYELQAMTKTAIDHIRTGGHGPDVADKPNAE